MTDKQAEVLTFLRDYFAVHNRMPSRSAVKRRFRLRGNSALAGHLRLLIAKGYLAADSYGVIHAPRV